MCAILTIPKVETVISTSNTFTLLHGYGLYYASIGNTNYPHVIELYCEKMGGLLRETFCSRAASGVGTYSNIQTRNNFVDAPTTFSCGGTLQLPVGTKLVVYGKK